MKPKKKVKKVGVGIGKANSRSGSSRPEPPPKSKAGGSFARDLALGLLICVVFFGLVEGGLRIAGVPARDFSEDPFVGFSGIQPLYSVKDGIASTAPSKLRYFNEASFKVQKPAGTVRMFCFGGSTTYGHPFDGRTSFSRWLQDLLKASCPDHDFEVINAGGISYASYRIVPLIKETLRYQPDLMIIYTGQNEFLERRTYAGLVEQERGLIVLRALLEELNTYRALRAILQPLLPSRQKALPADSLAKSGAASGREVDKPVLKEEVSAILDRSAGLDLYHRDEEFAKGVVQHFAYNLKAMISLCKAAGVPVIIVQPASNLKDFSPFKSEHAPNLTAAEKHAMKGLLSSLRGLLEAGKFEEALNVAQEVTRKDPLFAEAHFLKGRALLGLGRNPEAKSCFVEAKDLDVCPLRCVSTLEAQITAIVREDNTPFVPFREALERKAGESGDRSGIPGNESFLDHVHPTIENHQFAAEMILEKIQAGGLVHLSRSLAPAERQDIFKKGIDGLDPSFLGLRDLNLAKTLRWAGKKGEARFALENAAQRLPGNVEVHKMLGSYLLEDGNYEKAIEEYQSAVVLSGKDPELVFALAVAYYRSGRKGEAVATYKQLAQQETPLPEALANLAMIYLEDGKLQEAVELLESGLKATPQPPALFSPYGLALAMSGRISDAISWMSRAVKAEPGDPAHLYNLAGMYALAGNRSEALRQLDRAVQKGYADGGKLERDPVFGSIRDVPEFSRILDRIR